MKRREKGPLEEIFKLLNTNMVKQNTVNLNNIYYKNIHVIQNTAFSIF